MNDALDTVGTRFGCGFVALLLLCSVAPLAAGLALAHLRTDEADSWLFAYYGAQVLDGHTLYGEYWDNKPPGIFWINALGLAAAGGHYAGVIVLCIAAAVGVMVMFNRCAAAWYGERAAAVGTLLAAVFLWHQTYRGGTNRPETFVVLFDLATILMYSRAVCGGRLRAWILSGALAGCALACKQTGVAAGAAIVLHQVLLVVLRRQSLRDLAVHGAALATGTAATLAATVAVLALTADLRWAWYAVVTFVGAYIDSHPATSVPRWFGMDVHVHILALPAILAALGIVVDLARAHDGDRRPAPAAPPALTALLVCWWAGATWLVFSGPNAAMHYMVTALTPLLLLATAGIRNGAPLAVGGPAQRQVYRSALVLWCGYMLVTPLDSQLDWAKHAWYMRTEDPDPFGSRRLIELVEAHTAPDDAIFIWGYTPRTYWVTRRPCAARFTSGLNIAQIGRHGQLIVNEITAAIRARPPKLFALPHDAAMQMARGAWNRGGVDYTALGQVLLETFERLDPRAPGSLLIRRGDQSTAGSTRLRSSPNPTR